MAKGVVVLNQKGIRELLQSDEVRKDLEGRADAIADAAGPGFEADLEVGKNRARSSVRTTDIESMKAEAKDRALTRAIDAGRS